MHGHLTDLNGACKIATEKSGTEQVDSLDQIQKLTVDCCLSPLDRSFQKHC